MAACVYCRAETELYNGGVPICPKCSEERETKQRVPATDQQIRSTLLQDILELTARFTDASREFEVVTEQIPSGLPHPDGVQRIKNASNKLSTARIELIKAHHRLNEHCDRGIVPEDLKRSG
jgi:hypothetical protein